MYQTLNFAIILSMFTKTLVIFTFLISVLNASISITAQWNPSTVQVGEVAIYEVVIKGVNAENFPLGQEFRNANGLDYLGPMRSFNRSYINGEMSIQSIHRFNFQTKIKSQYNFSSYTVKIGKQTYSLPATTLKVVANKVPNSQTGNTSKISDLIKLTADKLPKIYLGQTFPLTVNMVTPSNQNLGKIEFNTPPLVTGNDFTAAAFGQRFDQISFEKNDQLWDAFKVTTLLTALKEGIAPLYIEWDYLLYIPDNRSNRRNPISSFFNNSLFSDLNRKSISKKATMPEFSLTVLPLPSEGKPNEFEGAIGEFTLDSSVSVSKVSVGEPVTVIVKVSGEGNFDRITAPNLELDSKHWKTYSPASTYQDENPESHLKGYRGTKTFEYIIIPLKDSIQQTPKLNFAYFSPQKEQYFSISLPPTPLNVTTDNRNIQNNNIAQKSITEQTQKTDPQPLSSENNFFRPITLENKGGAYSVKPWLKRSGFWVLQIFIGCSFLLFFYYQQRKKKWNQDPKARRLHRARKSIQFLSKQASRAINKKEYARFLEIARLQLSEAVAWENYENTPSLTHKEIEKNLQRRSDQLEMTELSTLMEILIAEEEIKYGQKEIPKPQWQDWQKTLLQSSKKLLS